jgi:hypothetical protein
MSDARQAAVCIVSHGDANEAFQRCFNSILSHTPVERIELRLAFAQSRRSVHYALGVLVPDGAWPARQQLPDGIERFHFTAKDGLPVWVWYTPGKATREQLVRLIFQDVPLRTDYAICVGEGSVNAGWWDRLAPLMDRGIDYIGQPQWHEYSPTEAERVQTQPWYMGVPLARRNGKPSVAFMGGGLVAVRTERLQGVEYSGEVALGEIANQMGWAREQWVVGSE